MPDDAEPPECFICTESAPAPRKSACLCTDRHMHAECLLKMLKAQKGEPKCSVCGALYEDVGWKTRRVVQCNSPCGFVVLMACTMIALTGCAINTAMVVPNLRKSQHGVIIFVSVVMAMGVGAAVGCIGMTVRNYGWRAVWASRFREERVFVVGAVRVENALPAEVSRLELGEAN
tara:strand:- start:59 stop:583 length:525 start_codon:yes stop_codon:yes gene_type:complete